MADMAISFQEAFPEMDGFIERAAPASTFKAAAKAVAGLLNRSGAMEKRMEGYRYAVASRLPFHSTYV